MNGQWAFYTLGDSCTFFTVSVSSTIHPLKFAMLSLPFLAIALWYGYCAFSGFISLSLENDFNAFKVFLHLRKSTRAVFSMKSIIGSYKANICYHNFDLGGLVSQVGFKNYSVETC